MSQPIIMIDARYYCFHRFFSLIKWWKTAYPDTQIENPIENPDFVDKFKKTFIEKIQEIPKKLKIDKNQQVKMIAGKDCKRVNIWRNELYPQYKGTRDNKNTNVGPFFKLVYEENLLQQAGVETLLFHPKLEADDCIALMVKKLRPYDGNIYIITSDCDYLQLNASNIYLYDLAYKKLSESKSFSGDAEYDLKLKIIMGDKSDNISAIFPKCGPKTAKKCLEDPVLFQKKLAEPGVLEKYNLNETLVSFEKIPEELQAEFLATL